MLLPVFEIGIGAAMLSAPILSLDIMFTLFIVISFVAFFFSEEETLRIG